MLRATFFILISFSLIGAVSESYTNETKPTCATSVLQIPFTPIASVDPYDLSFHIEQSEDDVYKLVATIDFHDGSYSASPLSNNDFTGLFHMEVAPGSFVTLDDEIEESPRSVETFDPIENVPVNWIRTKTTYKRVMHLKTGDDFDAGGKITFTIEPKCTFEVIPFMIKNRSGELTIEEWKC